MLNKLNKSHFIIVSQAKEGGSVAELVACQPTLPKVRVSNHDAEKCFIRVPFIRINDRQKVSNYTYVSYGFELRC
jgi:hypothetical protein